MTESSRTAIEAIRSKIVGLLNYKERRCRLNLDVFSNPEKHLICLPIDKIVSDNKVFPETVERYKRKLEYGETVDPVIVIKHPRYDVYAVLDGHHRYFAYLELGKKEVDCALAGDFSAVFFYLTDHGFFQPNPNAKELKKPELKLHDNIEEFLQNFLKDPAMGQKQVTHEQ